MARARNIKPGFYKNEDLAECSIWARFIFPGLWTLADRDGRLEDRPKRIKAELLPFDSEDVEPLLRELNDRKFILRYRNEDGNFIQILKFSTHQSPHYSEKQSVIKPPQPPEIGRDDGGKAPRKPPDDSGNNGGIKTGSQPPESLVLNPDSPNPDSGLSDSPNPDSGKKTKAARPKSPDAVLPDWLPAEPWGQYVEMRRQKRKPMTDKAVELIHKKLAGMRVDGQNIGAVLLQSVELGWTGVFPVKPADHRGSGDVATANERAAQTWLEGSQPAIEQ